MGVGREKPSTRARREGYAVLHDLKNLFMLLKISKLDIWHDETNGLGWRDYMVRHIPEFKRGGPAKSIGKRRKAKKKDRRSTIR